MCVCSRLCFSCFLSSFVQFFIPPFSWNETLLKAAGNVFCSQLSARPAPGAQRSHSSHSSQLKCDCAHVCVSVCVKQIIEERERGRQVGSTCAFHRFLPVWLFCLSNLNVPNPVLMSDKNSLSSYQKHFVNVVYLGDKSYSTEP